MMSKLVHDSNPPVKRTWSQESASVAGSAVTGRQSGQKAKRPKTQPKAPATVSSPHSSPPVRPAREIRTGDNQSKCLGVTLRCAPLHTSSESFLVTLGLEQNVNLPVGLRIRFFYQSWVKMGAKRRILRWICFGYPLKIQRKVNRVLGASKVNTFCSSFPCNHVQRSRQTVSAAESGERFGDQKVHCRNESGRNRVFLESIFSAEKGRGFQVSDRSVTAEQITGEGYISNGHTGPGKTGSTSRYVGNIHRPLRCVPSYPNQGGVVEVSMFSTGEQNASGI